MQVKPLYMERQELLTHKAIVTQIGSGEINKKNYHWIQLAETIFHPKGGGQLSDEGTIDGIKIAYVHKLTPDRTRPDQFEILHCFEEPIPFKEGDEVELFVDRDKRQLYSKMHTAGHALAEAVKEVFPALEASHGNHDPHDGYVKFKMLAEPCPSKEGILSEAQRQLQLKLAQYLPVSVVLLPSGLRGIQIGSQVMACGGTHVSNLREIGRVEVMDATINNKDKTVTIKYRLAG